MARILRINEFINESVDNGVKMAAEVALRNKQCLTVKNDDQHIDMVTKVAEKLGMVCIDYTLDDLDSLGSDYIGTNNVPEWLEEASRNNGQDYLIMFFANKPVSNKIANELMPLFLEKEFMGKRYKNCTFCLVTNYIDELSAPFKNRCKCIW